MEEFKLVVDASVVIDFLRRKDKFNSVYMQAVDDGLNFVMSGVTVAEVFAGESAQNKGGQNKAWEEILSGIEVRGVDADMARMVGEIRFMYRLSLADSFVAALALDLGLPVATLNEKDFEKVKGLKFYPAP